MSAATRYVIYLILLIIAGFGLYAGLAELPAPVERIETPAPAASAPASPPATDG